ncbi:MAG TPA: winged helix DNA-binding domain-containing protein [Propionibacteriaceae bacterium]
MPSDDVTRREVLRRRLATQRLSIPGLATPADAVRLLACVQAQEHAHALFSLGLRTDGLDEARAKAAFDEGTFVRTHILRPTWHYVAAEDLRWIQSVTADRVQRLNGTIYRREGLSSADLDRAADRIMAEVAEGQHKTRTELGQVLGAERFALAYLIMNAELEGLICSGPMRKAQHTYALVDERAPHSVGGDMGELARRFFVGHGPASVSDFARWSSLTLTQSRQAVDQVAGRLERLEVDGMTLWADPDAPTAPTPPPDEDPRAHLLPLFDEATLTYPQLNFPLADQHPHPPDAALYVGCVIVDETNVGTWRRTVQGKQVAIELALAPATTARARRAAELGAERLATFLGRRPALSVHDGG